MSWVILGLLLLGVAAFSKRIMVAIKGMIRRDDEATPSGHWTLRLSAIVLSVLCLLATSFVNVGENQTGHVVRIYAPNSLPPGRIIATGSGTAGQQARVIPPGVHFSFLINVLNKVEYKDILEVPSGQYAYLTAKDGKPLRPGQSFADPVPLAEFTKFVVDAEYALANGLQMGPQSVALPPGKYRINHYVWDYKLGKALDVEKGTVAIIKANVRGPVEFGSLSFPAPEKCDPILQPTIQGEGALSVPVVPVGCQGIWEVALPPGRYYINIDGGAYGERVVDTRLQQWEYKGGYKKRVVHLKTDESGKLIQTEDPALDIPVPEDSADPAISAKVEGWDVPIELRILVQVAPEDAPFTVAAVGGLQEVEDRVITPTIRAVTRDVVGGVIKVEQPAVDEKGRAITDEDGKPKMRGVYRQTQVLDLIVNRPVLEGTILEKVRPEGMKARVAIKEVRFGESVIPPEVLMPQQRQQLAEQLARAYQQEKLAQDERVKTEGARASADQQPRLIEAQIEQQRAVLLAEARKSEGQGEKDRLSLIAEGQRIQVTALGEERVVELRKYELAVGRMFDFLDKHPDVLTTGLANAGKLVPDRVFTINGAGADSSTGAFALLGEMLNPANGTTPPSAVKPSASATAK